jgi:hypothetical protein
MAPTTGRATDPTTREVPIGAARAADGDLQANRTTIPALVWVLGGVAVFALVYWLFVTALGRR